MLAYAAASRPVVAGHKSSPNMMLAIIGGHVALLAAVMSAKMELPPRLVDKPTIVDFIHSKKPPPPVPEIKSRDPREPIRETFTQPDQEVKTAPVTNDWTDQRPTLPNFTVAEGLGGNPQPHFDPPTVLRLGPQLTTPSSEIKPPYPASKLAGGEEAVLKLRLTIDERGRVTAVEPIGRVDRTFLETARRYILAHWRYRPATEDGRAVASSTVVTLDFQLDR